MIAGAWSIEAGVILRDARGNGTLVVCDDLAMEWDALAIPVESDGEALTERLLRRLMADDAAYRKQKARRDRVARRRKGGKS